jgi:hypothetical protein
MSPRGRPRKNKEVKRRAVKVRLCERMHSGKIVEPYRIMEGVIATERKDLVHLKIGIAWHVGWRPDADGVRTHGKCAKRSELDRSLDGYDAIIILNEKSWLAFGESDKLRLITHELEHIQIAADKNGEPLIDDKGRQVIRMKRHDVGDFASIIQKFGLPPCLTDIQIADADRPLLKLAEQKNMATAAPKDAQPAKNKPAEPECLALKFSGLRGCKAMITLKWADGYWYAGWWIQLGNQSQEVAPENTPARSSRVEALQAGKGGLDIWLEELAISGSADAKRAMGKRRDMMREQINQQLDPLLNQMEEEFAEDGPENKGKDADADEDKEI